MNPRNAVKLMQLVDSVDVSSCSQIDIFGQRCSNHLLSGSTHNFLQTCVNYILLCCAF